MLPAAYESYTTQIQGLLFLGLIIGTVLAELLVSGRLSDIITSRLARRNNNVRTPEMRIYLGYPGAVLAAVGAIIWGLSVDRHWHWITGQIAFVLCEYFCLAAFLLCSLLTTTVSAGLQLGNSAVSTYLFDCYPNNVVEMMTFYCFVLNVSRHSPGVGTFSSILTSLDSSLHSLSHGSSTTGSSPSVSQSQNRSSTALFPPVTNSAVYRLHMVLYHPRPDYTPAYPGICPAAKVRSTTGKGHGL